MKRQIYLSIIILFSLLGCNTSSESIFSDKTYKDSIKQNIGGLLIRDIHYSNDFHSGDYDIEYSYKDKLDSIYVIGSGSYYSKEPPKNEQLIPFEQWIIFKTSLDRDKDNLIIGNFETNTWIEYEISPETIEQEGLWRKQNISSRTDNWDSVSKIEKINSNGWFSVIYKYRKDGFHLFFHTGRRIINYKINNESGKPQMISVLEK